MRLPFPENVRGFEDLAITEANRSAFETIRRWKLWQTSALCLIGPVQCGLGIAAIQWAREAEARLLSVKEFDAISVQDIEALSAGNCIIDLADQVQNEKALLTLLNRVQARDKRLLMTARSPPGTWAFTSPDLRSRLEAMPIAEIYSPDEDMMVARLQASSKRHYIRLSTATINYLAIRLPRSYEAIEDYVHRLDQAIDQTGRSPSIHLARSVLEEGTSSRTLFSDEQD